MNFDSNKFAQAQQANLEAFSKAAHKHFADMEALVALNLAASKSVFAETVAHAKALHSVKSAQEFVAVQTEMVNSLAEKTKAYGHELYTFAATAQANLTEAVQEKAAESKVAVEKFVKQSVEDAPKAFEGVSKAYEAAVEQGQEAMETLERSAKSAVRMASNGLKSVVPAKAPAKTAKK